MFMRCSRVALGAVVVVALVVLASAAPIRTNVSTSYTSTNAVPQLVLTNITGDTGVPINWFVRNLGVAPLWLSHLSTNHPYYLGAGEAMSWGQDSIIYGPWWTWNASSTNSTIRINGELK